MDNNCRKIKLLSASVQSLIEDNYNGNGQLYKKAKWTFKENQNFINALKVYLNTDDLSHKIYVRNISWIKVTELANLNRNLTDIRQHWKLLRWKLTNFDYLEDNWSKRDSSKLIYVLFKSNFDKECDID